MSNRIKKTIAAVCVGLTACASVPEPMRVDTGNDPSNVNTDVRFRTTYYFRVFDFCADDRGDRTGAPISDSLYRFVMTGKANAFANRVKFESGTLRAEQIDPFGATVERDPQTGRLSAVPQTVVQARARRSETMEEIEALIALKSKLLKLNDDNVKAEIAGDLVVEETLSQIDRQINKLAEQGLDPGGLNLNKGANRVEAGLDNEEVRKVNVCPPGSEVQRGFQIMGPQGLKSFDQQERLLMAMTTRADPLISVLQRSSDRVLREKAETITDADLLLPILRERLIASEMQRSVLSNSSKGEEKSVEEVESLLDELINQLNRNASTEGEEVDR